MKWTAAARFPHRDMISARSGGFSVAAAAIETGVPEHILWMQSGYAGAQDVAAAARRVRLGTREALPSRPRGLAQPPNMPVERVTAAPRSSPGSSAVNSAWPGRDCNTGRINQARLLRTAARPTTGDGASSAVGAGKGLSGVQRGPQRVVVTAAAATGRRPPRRRLTACPRPDLRPRGQTPQRARA